MNSSLEYKLIFAKPFTSEIIMGNFYIPGKDFFYHIGYLGSVPNFYNKCNLRRKLKEFSWKFLSNEISLDVIFIKK